VDINKSAKITYKALEKSHATEELVGYGTYFHGGGI
jgi:hypothetical protein